MAEIRQFSFWWKNLILIGRLCMQRYLRRKSERNFASIRKKRSSGSSGVFFLSACNESGFLFSWKRYRNSIKSWKSILLFFIPLHIRRVKILWAGLRRFKIGFTYSSFGTEQGLLRLLCTQPHRKYQSVVHNSLLRTHEFVLVSKLPLCTWL